MADEHVLTMKSQDIDEQKLKSQGLTLVDFWAPWCGPCRMVGPVVEQIAEEYAGKLTVGKINVDEEAEAAMSREVQSIPTLVLFKDGIEVERIVGARNKQYFENLISKYI